MSLEKKLVSAIMPLYNKELYLKKTLNSLAAQTYPHFECIIVNDGSTDNSLQIASEMVFKDHRFKVIDCPHQGIISTIKTGWQQCRGEMVTRIDADDIYPPNQLMNMVNKLNIAGPYHIVTGKIQYFSDDVLGRGFVRYQNWINSMIEPLDYWLYGMEDCPLPSPAWLAWKEDLQEIDWMEKVIYPEDYYHFLLLMVKGFKIVSIDETVLLWRDYPNRSSRTLPQYKENTFFNLKLNFLDKYLTSLYQYLANVNKPVHSKFLLEKWIKKDKSVVIWGMGKKAKKIIQKMNALNLKLKFIITNNNNKIGLDYLKIPIVSESQILRSRHYILLALSSPEEKREVLNYLNQKGFLLGWDFISLVY